MSRARNAGKIAFWPGPAQPSAEIARVEGAKMQARLRAALLEEVSYETLVLETWHFTKRWFWRLGASLLEEVSCETLVLETWRSRTRRSFWRLGASPLRTFGGSLETLLLETWRFTCGAGLGPGLFVVQICGKEFFGAGLRSGQLNVVREVFASIG